MINTTSEIYTRRILTFPAIRPSESISPTTLLTSLTKLCHLVISHYKSNTLYTNKQNARKFIHILENILIFLEEIQNGCPKMLGSVFLSFSELHFIIQKAYYLIEDCTRHDARVLMLEKAENVSNQFELLTRSVALALDVLSLDLIDVCDESKELIELLRSQALKARFEVESRDKRVLEEIKNILRSFEGENVVELSELKRVVEYLGIRSWSECNREVKFLETEIELEWLTKEKRDVGLLSSLMVFMIYCRCALFDILDNLSTRKVDRFCRSEVISCFNLDDFRCPISLEIMTDPVTITTGHTYDRCSIMKWFNSGNTTCPMTGEKLISINLVPNLALKLLIKQYCSENCIPFTESGRRNHDILRTVFPGNVVAEKAMKMLAEFVVGRLLTGTSEERNKVAYEIRLLTKTSSFNRSCFVEAGGIPHLLDLLSDSLAQENSIAALLNLSKHGKSKRIMVQNGGLELLLQVLKNGLKMEARQHAAGVLFYIASIEEYRILIGEIPGVIPALIDLIRDGTSRAKKNALVAVFGLLMYPENHRRVIATGLLPLLLNFLPSFEKEDLTTDSLAVLATLAENLDGTMLILRAGGLPIIVEALNSCASKAAKEYCVSLLLALCINGGANVVPVLVKNSSLMRPLYSLLTEGSSRASKKASSLIRILHNFNEKSSSGLVNQVLLQEQFVHVL